ncbi:MAG TPA: peptidase S16, partial [Flavisolibacter sp.]|nr:peptidase S16 [Flavisolibacter sp.]
GITKEFGKDDDDLKSYDVAHHIGLSVQQEYEVLNLTNERQRQEYIRLHLAKVIPMVAQMEGLKEKIKLNGHFKNLTSFNFNL